jgi:UDP-N-acetyl-2-amino-2-deoxyglucuronate dehydrogenase
MKRFAITGVAGYVAPRHLQAIRDTGNTLVAALDPHDSVGVLDAYAPDTAYFTEFERFDRHLDKLRRGGEGIDYLSICAPSNLHDAHIRLALRLGADAICEKPLVLNPWNLDALAELEHETGHRVFTVLQLRSHPALRALRAQLRDTARNSPCAVCLTYVTARGPWYRYSWKGRPEHSGGVGTNIGIHLFDLLIWLFGSVQSVELHVREPGTTAGTLTLERARVAWFLSIDRACLPPDALQAGRATHRSITVDGQEIEFTSGFNDLHTTVYAETLAGRGIGIADARPSIELAHHLRECPVVTASGPRHPYLSPARAVT